MEVRGEKQCVGDEKGISSNLEGKKEEEQVEEIFTPGMHEDKKREVRKKVTIFVLLLFQ